MNSRGSKPYFDAPLPRIIAHRGFAPEGGTDVENTLPAFAAALALGATHLETDVHASRDGVAVISHDPDLGRLAGTASAVGSLDFAELATLDLGGGAVFSSLAETLAAFPTARFNIDIKSADAVAPTIAAVTAASAQNRVLVTSFSEFRRSRALRGLAVAYPAGVATSASAVRFAVALVAGRIGLTPLLRLALRGTDAVQVPERAMGLTVPTPQLLRQLHRIGVEMHVWTINDAPTMNRLLDLGVDGLVTDRTDIAIDVLRSRSGAPEN